MEDLLNDATTESIGSSYADWEASQAAGVQDEGSETAEPVEQEKTPAKEPEAGESEEDREAEGDEREPEPENQKQEEKKAQADSTDKKQKGDFAKLRDRIRDSESRNSQLQAEIEKLKNAGSPQAQAKQEPNQDEAPKRPKLVDFDDIDKYEAALEKYDNESYEYRNRQVQKQAAERQQQEYTAKVNQSRDQVKDLGRTQYADFDEVALAQDVPVTDAMAHVLDFGAVRSEDDRKLAANVLYHLGKNKEIAKKIASLPSPIMQGYALGQLVTEFKLKGQATSTPGNTAKTQPVVKPSIALSGAGGPTPVGPKNDGNDFKRWEKAEEAKARRN